MIGEYRYNYKISIGMKWETYLKAEEAREWCKEVFGKEYTGRWGCDIDGFNFNSEKDYELFLLRWA
jgi:hypothetical protein